MIRRSCDVSLRAKDLIRPRPKCVQSYQAQLNRTALYASVGMERESAADYIVGVLLHDSLAPPKWGLARRYNSRVRVKANVRDVVKTTIQNILYEIVPRGSAEGKTKYPEAAFREHSVGVRRGCCIFSTPEDTKRKLLAMKFRHSHTPNWETFNFSGMVRRLAAWLSYVTWQPDASLSVMCKNGKLRLQGMNNSDEVCGLSGDRVFISRSVAVSDHVGVFWALAWAAHANGSSVLTEFVELDHKNNCMIQDLSGASAWHGVVEALAILAELYDAAGCGDVFSLHFAAGLHSISSVVAHSDEGGFMRDVFRCVSTELSFGGLPPASVRCSSIPHLAKYATYKSLCTWVDSYLLVTAAAVAHADPLCNVGDGILYPTVVEAEPGTGRDVLGRRIGQGIIQGFRHFSKWYLHCLNRLLGLATMDDQDRGIGALCGAGEEVCGAGSSRHLNHQVVAPYFWIEPTTLLRAHHFGTSAEAEGWASYGAGREEKIMPFLPNAVREGAYVDDFSEWNCLVKGARQFGAILFLSNRTDDGLANIIPWQADTSLLTLTGLDGISAAEALDQGKSLHEYLWTRGQSWLPHPAEMLNLGRSMVLRVVHYIRQGRFASFAENIPLAGEIGSEVVKLNFEKLCQIEDGELNREPPQIDRIRNAATRALNHASQILGLGFPKQYTVLPVCHVAPPHPGLGAVGIKKGTAETTTTEGVAKAGGEGLNVSKPDIIPGYKADPVIHHEAMRGPQIARGPAVPSGSVVIQRPAVGMDGRPLPQGGTSSGDSPESLASASGLSNTAGGSESQNSGGSAPSVAP